MIRRFFDSAATGEPAGTVAETGSIAALMAKYGTQTSTGEPASQPITIQPEKKEEPAPATEPAPAATATQTPPAEPATPETPSQPVAEEPKPEPQTEPPVQVSPPTLQEVLRQHQPAAILKELGYDDKVVNELKELDPKMIAFLTHWKQNGDVTAFLRELSTDYSKMPAEEVMRHQLSRDYPRASPQQIEALFKAKVVNAYNLNSDDEAEQTEGKMLLEAEADKYRDKLMEQQQQFLIPKPPEPKAEEPDNSAQLAQQEFEAYKSKVTDHSYTKNIFATKQLVLGEGDEKFTFPVEPTALTEILFDSRKWAEAIHNKDGSPNVELQMLLGGVAKYGKDFFNSYAAHYKSLGGKKVVDTLENPSPPSGAQASPAEIAPKTAAEAMARYGKLS